MITIFLAIISKMDLGGDKIGVRDINLEAIYSILGGLVLVVMCLYIFLC